jgi:DNA-binding transcriptional LysR family regulator
MFAWDDFAVFLALYRERTTGRAADSLGISQPTVTRRLAAFEQALGLVLFERTPTGLHPTQAAERLVEPAQRVERSICELTAEIDVLSGAEINLIRLTMLDHFEQFLVPILRDFRQRWPRVETQLLASDHLYDLARGEADIGVRGRARPTSDEIVVHDLPPSGWTVYAAVHLPAEQRPNSPADLAGNCLATVEGMPGTLPVYTWLKSLGEEGSPLMRCSNYRALKSAIASGAALSALPCTIGDGDPDLVRCFDPLPDWDVPIYLVGRRAVLRRPPARDLFDSIARYFRDNPSVLSGVRG